MEESGKNSFLQYLMRIFPAIAVLTAVTLMTHGSILFAGRIGIDTEYMICGNDNFDQMGRQGLIWLADILEIDWFNPWLVQVLTIVFLVMTPVIFGYVFCRYSGQKEGLNITLIVLGCSCIVSPFWMAQVYFFNQSAQVTCSCVLTAVAVLLAEEGRRKGKTGWYDILFSILLMQFTFSSYQILVILYAVSVAMVFLCSALKENRTVKQHILWISAHLGIFLTGFVLYWVIAKKFFYSAAGSAYQSGLFKWNDGFRAGLYNSLSAVLYTLKKNPPYCTGFYGVFSLFVLVVVVCRGVKAGWFRERRSTMAFILPALLFLILSPYIFIFFCGGQLEDRMQLILPFSQGCMLYLSVELLFFARGGEKDKGRENEDKGVREDSGYRKWVRKGIAVVLTLAVVKNTLTDMGYCNRIYYTDEWRYQYDKQLAHDISTGLKDYLEENGYDENLYERLIFLGYPQLPYNNVSMTGNVAGKSVFAYDIGIDDTYRPRIVYFMKCVGYPVVPEPYFTEGAKAAYYVYFGEYFGERVDAMPSFPAQGSIQYLESDEIGLSYLVVKLGPDWRRAIENPANVPQF